MRQGHGSQELFEALIQQSISRELEMIRYYLSIKQNTRYYYQLVKHMLG